MKTLLNFAALTALSATALMGCNSTASNTQTKVQQTTTAPQAMTRTFRCQNGFMPKIIYLNTNQAQITVQDKSQVLTVATSGSGTRYVATTGMWGTGAEWHEKGQEAILTFKGTDGSTVETACQAL